MECTNLVLLILILLSILCPASVAVKILGKGEENTDIMLFFIYCVRVGS